MNKNNLNLSMASESDLVLPVDGSSLLPQINIEA